MQHPTCCGPPEPWRLGCRPPRPQLPVAAPEPAGGTGQVLPGAAGTAPAQQEQPNSKRHKLSIEHPPIRCAAEETEQPHNKAGPAHAAGKYADMSSLSMPAESGNFFKADLTCTQLLTRSLAGSSCALRFSSSACMEGQGAMVSHPATDRWFSGSSVPLQLRHI